MPERCQNDWFCSLVGGDASQRLDESVSSESSPPPAQPHADTKSVEAGPRADTMLLGSNTYPQTTQVHGISTCFHYRNPRTSDWAGNCSLFCQLLFAVNFLIIIDVVCLIASQRKHCKELDPHHWRIIDSINKCYAMIIHSTPIFQCSRVLALVVTLGLISMCPVVHTFGIASGVLQRSLKITTSLQISLWEADLTFNVGDNRDTDVKFGQNPNKSVRYEQAKQIEIIKYKKKQVPSKPIWCPFYFYLHQQQRSIRDPSTKALHMDDEMKRMESKYHQLGGDDLPQIYYPLGHGLDHYNGDLVRPNERSYELILRAYARSNLGVEGAEFAEALVARYEKFNTSKQATTKMIAFVMKAWIAARNLEQSELWLHRIENRYRSTQLVSDFPGYYIYNPFVIGLGFMANVSPRTVAKRSMEVLEKIDALSGCAKNYEMFPGREIYLNIMKYQEYGYKGTAAFFRIEKIFRLLQKNYRSSGYHPRLKPCVEALTPVIVAASKCHFPSDDRVIERVNVLFDEFDQLYQVTGDPDFCPNGTICNSLNSIYARMNRHQMNFGDFTKRTTLLLQRMEEYNIKFKDPRDKTSAFNRILHAAESQLPDNPIGEPVETREIFILVLNIFKKFHFAADGDEDADLYSEDDCKTYKGVIMVTRTSCKNVILTIYPRYAQNMHKICPTYAQDMPKIFPR